MTGMKIDCVSDGKEAVERFTTNGDDYDIILMDVQMPYMNGYQATEAIRKSGHPKAKTIPIIAMTADAFHEDISEDCCIESAQQKGRSNLESRIALQSA